MKTLIIVRDEWSQAEINLFKNRAEDNFWYGTKARLRAAFERAIDVSPHHENVVLREIDEPSQKSDFNVRYVNGKINIGCHTFSEGNTKIIFKWAHVIKTKSKRRKS